MLSARRMMVPWLFLLCWIPSSWGVAPGGIYTRDESMVLHIDPKSMPTMPGFHLVRGWSSYHARRLNFVCGVFLPPAYFRSLTPLPIVMTLHNRFGIGADNQDGMTGEGMGRMFASGGFDNRAAGDKATAPITLQTDAQFIGLAPQCPLNFGWESPPMATVLCNFIAKAVTTYHADDDRVYLTGFSYGASSTWRVALLAPERFAAIIVCDGRATPDPMHDVEKLKNIGIYLEVGQWDGEFVGECDRMHQALNMLPHRNYIFHMIPGGNHFCYQTVYDDPMVWKWIFLQKRKGVEKSH